MENERKSIIKLDPSSSFFFSAPFRRIVNPILRPIVLFTFRVCMLHKDRVNKEIGIKLMNLD